MTDNKYLPIGSVVLLKGANKRLMIYGRKQLDPATDIEYDYGACLFPEGNIEADKSFLFNAEEIDRLYFIGYQDKEEDDYSAKYLNN